VAETQGIMLSELSHRQLQQVVAALLEAQGYVVHFALRPNYPHWDLVAYGPSNTVLGVYIEDREGAPRYDGRVSLEETMEWLQGGFTDVLQVFNQRSIDDDWEPDWESANLLDRPGFELWNRARLLDLISNHAGLATPHVPSIFLSHSTSDKSFVRNLAEQLSLAGVRVWLDEAEIKIGESLTEKIGQAIWEADFVGAVLSANSIQSNWVQKELQLALQKGIQGRKIVVLPILLELVEIPPFLRDKAYANFTSPDRFSGSLKKLLEALGITSEAPRLDK
jgi:hypothetical protein